MSKWKNNVQIDQVFDLKSNTSLSEEWDNTLDREFWLSALLSNIERTPEETKQALDVAFENDELGPFYDEENEDADEIFFLMANKELINSVFQQKDAREPSGYKSNIAFKASIPISRSAYGVFRPGDRRRKTAYYNTSEIWSLYVVEDDNVIPVYFAMVHTMGDIVYINHIWKSVYGAFLLHINRIEPTKFKGLGILLFSETLVNHSRTTLGIRDATTDGSRIMFTKAGVEMYDREGLKVVFDEDGERVYDRNERANPLLNRVAHALRITGAKEWFMLDVLRSDEFRNQSFFLDEKRLKLGQRCVTCGSTSTKKQLYTCKECRNAVYCGEKCQEINNHCINI